ncbi:hypothetical protein AB6F55_10035 [Providencia hangzhouensis]
MVVYGCAFISSILREPYLEKEIAPDFVPQHRAFSRLSNGFGTFLGAVLCGWAIELNTVEGIVDWKTFWLIFTGYTASFTALYLYLYVVH